MTQGTESSDTATEVTPGAVDPRALLAEWANSADEWARMIVADVLATGRPVDAATIEKAYALFRQEKALDTRELPSVAALGTEARQDESAPPLTITRLSDVHGVNALVTGSVIEPHAGLTILYGENGTGKTGYSRIFKMLADSRTADEILGNIDADGDEDPSAQLAYALDGADATLDWKGERGVSPFTRMSIFDSPSVNAHVDEDLEYVYVPAALALFTHTVSGIQAVAAHIDSAISAMGSGATGLVGRFQRGSTIYPLIESLGASTDLSALKAKASTDPEVDKKVDGLTQAVAALRANTLGTQIAGRKREQRALAQAETAATALLGFDETAYNDAVLRRAALAVDYNLFRSELFAAADLPAEPEDTWNDFITAGDAYRQHLVSLDVHDEGRCLYCRQPVETAARELLSRYSAYLEDKISADIREVDGILASKQRLASTIATNEITSFLAEFADEGAEKPAFHDAVASIQTLVADVVEAVGAAAAVRGDIAAVAQDPKGVISKALVTATTDIAALEAQSSDRAKALSDSQAELRELKDSAELTKSWGQIETQVKAAKEADQLRTLRRPLAQLARSVTELAKTASDQLINQNFGALFVEECEALRAPALKVQFVGREGKAQRRKVLSGRHKPSKVLSEGEQKVLALADFLAEARLAGITAPVIFDDPVSSLDHRRVGEVARRIARLSEDNQVIVFTHDILFTTNLLAQFEKSKRVAYFQLTDDGGKGKVTKATGPRSDSIKWFKAEINRTIEAAGSQEGEAKAALVDRGYSLIRSWCEVFTETELLQGVTRRLEPNVSMGRLGSIKLDALADISPKVNEIFEAACRFTEAHSQPLVTLGVSATLDGLKGHWAELQELKTKHDGWR